MSDSFESEVEKLKKERVISEKTAELYLSNIRELINADLEKNPTIEGEIAELKDKKVVSEKTAEIYLSEIKKVIKDK